MPIYSDKKARTIAETALKFTYKFKLGDIETCYEGFTYPPMLITLDKHSVAYKFSNRPGLYRIVWNPKQDRYDVYWACAPKK